MCISVAADGGAVSVSIELNEDLKLTAVLKITTRFVMEVAMLR